MNGENINISTPRILVAPLDWGLGHATRCIPLIKELRNQGAEVFIGVGNMTGKVLMEEFPSANFLNLPDYKITYSKNNRQSVHLLKQVPRAFITATSEQRLLKSYMQQFGFKAIISDNRPGLWSPGIPSVYITHQLVFCTGNKFMNEILRSFHRKIINRFSECWVPDDESHSLSGKLSEGRNIKFCGPLSRLRYNNQIKDIEWLLLLSGPEPQRSILEKKLVNIFKHKNAVLVRGSDISSSLNYELEEVYNIATGTELEKLVSRSKTVICRSGYSSIMDMSVMQADVVLVPTPGQSEQEYLAKFHHQNGAGLVLQEDLSFENLQKKAGKLPATRNVLLEKRVKELLKGLK